MDEITYLGHVPSIHKTGLQKREMNNVTLRLSLQSHIQVVENKNAKNKHDISFLEY